MSKFIKFIVLLFVIGFMYFTYTSKDDNNKNKILSNDAISTYNYGLAVDEGQAGNIEIVKQGVIDYDKSLTVGEAFDNWKACHKNASWTTFETDNKRKIVQFTCDAESNHFNKHFIFQFTINKDTTFTLSYIGEEYIDTDGILSTSSASRDYSAILEDIYENKTRFDLN